MPIIHQRIRTGKRKSQKTTFWKIPTSARRQNLKVRELYALQNSDELFESDDDEVSSNFKKGGKKSKTDKKKAVVEEVSEDRRGYVR